MQLDRSFSRIFLQVKMWSQQNLIYFLTITMFMCLSFIGITKHINILDESEDADVDYPEWIPEGVVADTKQEVCRPESELKTILFWNKYYGSSNFHFGLGQDPFSQAGCSCTQCQLTSDRTQLDRSDAVIFHSNAIDVDDMPPLRHPHQKWIFYTFTAPVNHRRLPPQLRDKFNLTMTYRRDSDIVNRFPLGGIVSTKKKNQRDSSFSLPPRPAPSSPPKPVPSANLNQKKKLMALIETGPCQSRSAAGPIVSALRKYISVDVYDNCKRKNCGDETQCNEMLRRDYKFVLVVEPTLCSDFVSKELYTGLLSGAVPVVYGHSDYDAYAPVNSYINAADFVSAKQLADFLLVLNSNQVFYSKYLAWNRDYAVDRYPKQGWCQLCEILNKDVANQFYGDINSWWFDSAYCSTTYPHSG